MSSSVRPRGACGLWLALLVAAGLGSRGPGLPEFCLLYVGDLLWGAMFFVLYGCGWPAAPARRVWQWATATTVIIELSQLCKVPWLQAIRATACGRLLLGNTFLWSDVASVVLGATAAALIDEAYRRRAERGARLAATPKAKVAFVAWFTLNVASVGVVACGSYALRPPPESWGKFYYGGPGDGFVFLFFMFLPAFVCLLANVLAIVPVVRDFRARASTVPAIAYLAVVLLWLRVGALDNYHSALARRLGS